MFDSIIKSIAAIGQRITKARDEKELRDVTHCEGILKRAGQQRASIQQVLEQQDLYLDVGRIAAWRGVANELNELAKGKGVSRGVLRRFMLQIQELTQFGDQVRKLRVDHNRRVIEGRKKQFAALLSSIEGRALDNQQIDCILKEDENVLVVAGAGSGKTTTIVGRVKYLLQTGQCSPDEILVLSFTNASAAEMAERLKKETRRDIDVMTFHKLGLSVIAQVEGKKPSIAKDGFLRECVRDTLRTLMNDSAFLALLVHFITAFMKEYISPFEVKSEKEYLERTEGQLTTIHGERVKSMEEVEIANFLFLHGVSYQYERAYKIDTASAEHGQYHPDFYLPDYDIYIEHFGINKNGDVPPFFRGEKGKSARQVYHEGMEWKRKTHKENGTTLVESYSWEKFEGTLTPNLRGKLQAKGVTFKQPNPDELIQLLDGNGRTGGELQGLQELIATFINLAKANALSGNDLHERNRKRCGGFDFLKNEAFLQITTPIYERYNAALTENGEVDFNDMINKATLLVDRFAKSYKSIIIDEYQDISMSRYRLVKAIRDRNKAKLFCVGDDWQSIYRFAGSDTNLFTDFEKYWGSSEQCLIETTYRFGAGIIDASDRFVMKNPRQIRKSLRSTGGADSFISVLQSSDERYVGTDLKAALDRLPQGCKVMLLGRYNQDLRHFLGGSLYEDRNGKIAYSDRRDLEIEFLTVHRSKGLQADHVFILNNKEDRMGFPSNIQDSSVLKLVLENKEDYPHAEERRLFYVALTRAKQNVSLVTIKGKESVFIKELEQYGVRGQQRKCPECGHMLVLRNGRNGKFWGCSGYPACRHTES